MSRYNVSQSSDTLPLSVTGDQVDRTVALAVGVAVGALLCMAGIVLLAKAGGSGSNPSSMGGPGGVRVEGPSGLVLAVAGVILLIACVWKLGGDSSPTASPSNTTSSSSASSSASGPSTQSKSSSPSPSVSTSTTVGPPCCTPTPSLRPHAVFSSPKPNSSIRAGQDVRVSGLASAIPAGDTLWIVTTASHGDPGKYYLTSDAPLLTASGPWDFTDSSVGDQTDVQGTITYRAILADKSCNRAIQLGADRGGDPVEISPPPSGCVDLADVTVSVKA